MMNHSECLGLQESEMPGSTNLQSQSPDQMIQVPTKFEGQNPDIIWSGDSSICCKQLKHYPAFSRNGTTVAVYSFAFIMTGEGSHHIGYLEDLYEDYRRQKMVKVRWFHRSQEVSGVIPEPRPHEVIITPHVQVVSAECIDGLATILTPRHYEQCLAVVSHEFSYGIYMCSRQIKKSKVTQFPLSKLRGYSSQTIFSALDFSINSNKLKQQISSIEEKEEHVALQGAKETQTSRGVVTNSVSDNQVEKTQPTHPKLNIKLSSEKLVSIKLVGSEPHHQVPSFCVGEKIELLSHDSGMRGCWFRCKILQASEKGLKVLYMDVEDVEGPGNLEEWVLAYRVAAPDKLGMRCLGRHIIRPCPTKNSSNTSFSIGAPVDAWWCDGWWEGVVVGTNIRGENNFHVYFPGENRFQNFQKKNLRTSKDWVVNRWVEIKPKPDILSFVSSNVNSKMKLQRCSTLGGPSGSGSGSSSVDNKVFTSSGNEAVEMERQEQPVSAATDVVKKVKDVTLKKKA